jgi:hypothetical protein
VDLLSAAKALGGTVYRGRVLCPGPVTGPSTARSVYGSMATASAYTVLQMMIG